VTGDRVEPGNRLVQDEQLWPASQGDGESNLRMLTA
jgi:hypothetical protein